jgi:hypothetical protein
MRDAVQLGATDVVVVAASEVGVVPDAMTAEALKKAAAADKRAIFIFDNSERVKRRLTEHQRPGMRCQYKCLKDCANWREESFRGLNQAHLTELPNHA